MQSLCHLPGQHKCRSNLFTDGIISDDQWHRTEVNALRDYLALPRVVNSLLNAETSINHSLPEVKSGKQKPKDALQPQRRARWQTLNVTGECLIKRLGIDRSRLNRKEGSKEVCGLRSLRTRDCTLLSIGSNHQFNFEVEIAAYTR